MTTTEILTGVKNWVSSKLSLKQDVINDLAAIRSGSQAGSTAVQPSDLSSYFNNASYDTNTHRINFYHGQNIVAYVDASPFIVDGMVNDVRIENGYLVIDFNTDSGKQDISIPLTDIFNPNNYYTKGETDLKFTQKQSEIDDLYARICYYVCSTEGNVAAKTIVANDYTLGNGGSIKVKMTNANTADNATLNINSTGAKALYYAGERASANNSWEAGETVEVYYDGTSYYANNVTGGSGSGDGAFDVSVKYPTSGVDGGNTYTLDGALAVLNANLSANKKKGGMSIKFIQSSDNKYVQFRYMSSSTANADFTNVANWQGVDEEPTQSSKNLVESGGVTNLVGRTSKIISFTGQGNTFSTGIASEGFVPNKIYRLYVPVTSWDMTGVTSTGTKFAITAYNASNDVSITIASSYAEQSVEPYYDIFLPSTVSTSGGDVVVNGWSIGISGRAASGTDVVVAAELHDDVVTTKRQITYTYLTKGSKEEKRIYYNFQKGHEYELVLDTTGLTIASMTWALWKNGSSIIDFGNNMQARQVVKFIPDNDYSGLYFRFYINTGALGTLTTSVRDVSVESLREKEDTMNLISVFQNDLKVGSLYSGNIDPNQQSCRYIDNYYPVIPGSSLSFIYGERSDGKEVCVRVQFYKSDKTWIRPNDSYTHLQNKDVPYNAAYCRFAFQLYYNGEESEFTGIVDGEIAIDTKRTVIIDNAVKQLNNVVVKTIMQDLTQDEVNTVTENLNLGGEFSKEFIKSSSSHSSGNDRIKLSVNKGNPIKVGLFTSIANPSIDSELYGYDENNQSFPLGSAPVNGFVSVELYRDLKYIGVYLSAATTPGTYSLRVIGGVANNPQYNGVDIISLNGKAIEHIIASKCQAYKNSATLSNYANIGYNRYLTFLQLTDTHADFTCMERALYFADNTGLISHVLHTGDIIENGNSAGRKESEWNSLLGQFTTPVLTIPGNHEFSTADPYTDNGIHSWLYNSDFQQRNGDIHPVINSVEKNYWHKDIVCPDYYIDGSLVSGKKIRIIGTYDFEFPDSEVNGVINRKDLCWYTQEQIDWLISKLDETLSGEYVGVMILSHYILSLAKYIDACFTPEPLAGTNSDGDIMSSPLIENSNVYFFAEILDAFVNGGTVNTSVTLTIRDSISTTLTANHTFASAGKFIANVCGHKHYGGMLNMLINENQTSEKLRVIMSPCSTNKDVQNSKWWGRSDYNNKLFPNNIDCLNAITYDHVRDKVKVVRIGATTNNNLEECKAFCF